MKNKTIVFVIAGLVFIALISVVSVNTWSLQDSIILKRGTSLKNKGVSGIALIQSQIDDIKKNSSKMKIKEMRKRAGALVESYTSLCANLSIDCTKEIDLLRKGIRGASRKSFLKLISDSWKAIKKKLPAQATSSNRSRRAPNITVEPSTAFRGRDVPAGSSNVVVGSWQITAPASEGVQIAGFCFDLHHPGHDVNSELSDVEGLIRLQDGDGTLLYSVSPTEDHFDGVCESGPELNRAVTIDAGFSKTFSLVLDIADQAIVGHTFSADFGRIEYYGVESSGGTFLRPISSGGIISIAAAEQVPANAEQQPVSTSSPAANEAQQPAPLRFSADPVDFSLRISNTHQPVMRFKVEASRAAVINSLYIQCNGELTRAPDNVNNEFYLKQKGLFGGNTFEMIETVSGNDCVNGNGNKGTRIPITVFPVNVAVNGNVVLEIWHNTAAIAAGQSISYTITDAGGTFSPSGETWSCLSQQVPSACSGIALQGPTLTR